jgi:hypothetical protein
VFESVLSGSVADDARTVASLPFMKEFYLAGGTGAALRLGHRVSRDLDLFSRRGIDPGRIRDTLREAGHFIVDQSDSRTLWGRFNDTKVSFFHYSCPLLRETNPFMGMSVASLVDIACMKLDAVSSRGKKRDFIDLFFILEVGEMDVPDLLGLYEKKYGVGNVNRVHLLKSMVYFDDAENDPEPRMLIPFSWNRLKDEFRRRVREFGSPG